MDVQMNPRMSAGHHQGQVQVQVGTLRSQHSMQRLIRAAEARVINAA